ncbi:hypothetical protein KAR48_12090 [bacterium]|nr:hypothetical protein [bacterium]
MKAIDKYHQIKRINMQYTLLRTSDISDILYLCATTQNMVVESTAERITEDNMMKLWNDYTVTMYFQIISCPHMD